MSSETEERVEGFYLAFGTPRKLPKHERLRGRVAVLDIAFVSESGGHRFEKITLRLIDGLGERLAAWVDHHDSKHHRRFAADPRFLLTTKGQHAACPELITPELVRGYGQVDTILCHVDFDGLVSAAKWIRQGIEPYPGSDEDARAVDTCLGEPSDSAARIERALRARPRDQELRVQIVQHLATGLEDASLWGPIDEAGEQHAPLEQHARRLAEDYRRISDDLSLVDVSADPNLYDKTLLLLLGQQRTTMAAVVDGDTVTFAAPFDSGVDFVRCFELSGGMPTRVSIHRKHLTKALRALGVDPEVSWELGET